MTPLPVHERRRPVDAPAWFRLELARRLVADDRWTTLTPGQRLVIHVGVTHHADGAGRLWPAEKTLAREVGVTRRQVQLALASAARCGLITVAPYVRANGRQGANTITVDSAIVDQISRGANGSHPLPSRVRGERIDGAQGANDSSARKGRTDRTPWNVGTVRTGEIDQEGKTPSCQTCADTRVVDAGEDERGYSQSAPCPDCSPRRGAA